MKLFISLLGLTGFNRNLNKKRIQPLGLDRNPQTDSGKREALIQTGRQQFKKLQELGLQIPIAVL